jgi:serine/threonine protein kinase
MPPKLPKPMTGSSSSANKVQKPKEAESKPSEMLLGGLRVGRDGITFSNPDDSAALPGNMAHIDDLVFVRELGKGASGTVGLYKHKTGADRYAVKKINIAGKTSRDTATCAAEIRNVFAMPSPNAVRLFNAFVRDGQLLLIMEYMDGGNLEELLLKQPVLGEAACSYVSCQMLSALQSMHRKNAVVDHSSQRKTVHRDIKPANVMLSRDAHIKLADFGVAGSADSIGLASFVGTATYMSPERIKGQRYGTASDIWSLGIVVAQMLLGRYPFKSVSGGFMALLKEVTSTQRLNLGPEFSVEAQDFIDQCLKQDSDTRSSAADLLEHPWIRKHNGSDQNRADPTLPSSPTNHSGQLAFRDIMSAVGIARERSMNMSSLSQPSTPAVAAQGAPQTPLVPVRGNGDHLASAVAPAAAAAAPVASMTTVATTTSSAADAAATPAPPSGAPPTML